MPQLTNFQHEQFAQGCFAGKTQKQSAIDAGYSVSTATNSSLLMSRYPAIKERIQELHDNRAKAEQEAISLLAIEIKIDKAWVLARLVDVHRLATALEDTPILDSMGFQTGAKDTFNPGAALKALELIGKEIGMFVDKQENTMVFKEVSAEPMTEDKWIEHHSVETLPAPKP